jgi:hypothetical protein
MLTSTCRCGYASVQPGTIEGPSNVKSDRIPIRADVLNGSKARAPSEAALTVDVRLFFGSSTLPTERAAFGPACQECRNWRRNDSGGQLATQRMVTFGETACYVYVPPKKRRTAPEKPSGAARFTFDTCWATSGDRPSLEKIAPSGSFPEWSTNSVSPSPAVGSGVSAPGPAKRPRSSNG